MWRFSFQFIRFYYLKLKIMDVKTSGEHDNSDTIKLRLSYYDYSLRQDNKTDMGYNIPINIFVTV